MEIGTEAAKSPEKEYINGIFLAVCLMLSQPKSAMAAPQRELETSIQPLKRPTDYQQSVSPNYGPNIISQLMFAFTGRNRFISMKSLWRPPAMLIYAYIYPYISKIS